MVIKPVSGKIKAEEINAIFSELDSNKRDSNTEIQMSDLSQEVKLGMTGGGVPIVGVDAVGTINVKNGAITNNKLDIAGVSFPTTYILSKTVPTGASSSASVINTPFINFEVGDIVSVSEGSSIRFAVTDSTGTGVSGAWRTTDYQIETSFTGYIRVNKAAGGNISDAEAATYSAMLYITKPDMLMNTNRLKEYIFGHGPIPTFDRDYNNMLLNNQIVNDALIYFPAQTVASGENLKNPYFSFNNFKTGDYLYCTFKITSDNPNYATTFKVRQKNGTGTIQKTQNPIYAGDGVYFAAFELLEPLKDTNILIEADRSSASTGVEIKEISVGYKGIYIKPAASKRCYVTLSGNDSNDGTTKETGLATFQQAINMGAEEILAERGIYRHQTIKLERLGSKLSIKPCNSDTYSTETPNRQLIEIDNGLDIPTPTLTSGTWRANFAGNERFKKVFVDKNINPDTGGIRPGYNAALWECHTDSKDDVLLKPVLTLTECSSTPGTFYFSGTMVYINPSSPGTYSYKAVYDTPQSMDSVITLANLQAVSLNDVYVKYANDTCFSIKNCMQIDLTNCKGIYTSLTDIFELDYSNGEVKNCLAEKARVDGFNVHGYGCLIFVDCKAFHNGDDGLSPHDGCVGTINGGSFKDNGKAGIAVSEGADYNIYNVSSELNEYGYWFVGNDAAERDVKLYGCVARDNAQAIRTDNKYNVDVFNCDLQEI